MDAITAASPFAPPAEKAGGPTKSSADAAFDELLNTPDPKTAPFIGGGQMSTAETAYEVMKVAEAEASPTLKPIEEEDEQSDAVQAFLDYMKLTPEERFFEAFLADEGMSREEFEALPPEEQAKLLEKFKLEMEQKVAEGVAEKLSGLS